MLIANPLKKNMFLTVFKSIVRPHLEYGSSVWSVIYKKEATKLIKNIQHKTYTQRLKYLGLPSLQYRRLRADMIETYKILNNIDKVQYEQILPLSQTTVT